jgi:hypothetical protein
MVEAFDDPVHQFVVDSTFFFLKKSSNTNEGILYKLVNHQEKTKHTTKGEKKV